MPLTGPLTVLLASQQAETVKRITMSLRSYHPGCRVEAVYSTEEAIEWATKDTWQVILIDEDLPAEGGLHVLPELRRRAPNAAIIVQSERSDPSVAIRALRDGGDFYLFKDSPAFLTQLMVVIGGALEIRCLRTQKNLAQSRYLRLIEMLTDLVYELDKEGRFVFVSESAASLLGYSPQELIGAHYSSLLQPDDQHQATHRFNERRTGPRATRNLPVRLRPKQGVPVRPRMIEVALNAQGLYDPRNHFIGTVGIARDLSTYKEAEAKIQELQNQALQGEDLLEFKERITSITHDLSLPISSILGQTHRLLRKVQDLELEHHLEGLASQASHISQLGRALTHSVQDQVCAFTPLDFNAIIEEAIGATTSDLEAHHIRVERRLAVALPLVQGEATQLRRLCDILISKAAQAMYEATGSDRLCVISQGIAGLPGFGATVRVEISDGGVEALPGDRISPRMVSGDEDWVAADGILKNHAGTLAVAPSTLGGLVLEIWLPASNNPQIPRGDAGASLSGPTGGPEVLGGTPPDGSDETQSPPCGRDLEPHDRRQSPRTDIQIDAHLTLDGTTWSGRGENLSLTGLYLVFEGLLPLAVNQPLHVGLVSEVAVLQLHGTVRGIREIDRRRVGTKVFPALGVAVQLVGIKPEEHLILASLIEGIRDRSVSISLTLQVTAEGAEDSVLEVRPGEGGSPQQIPLHPFPPEGESTSLSDQRFVPRVNFVMLARLEPFDNFSTQRLDCGRTVNLSMVGASLRLKGPIDPIGHRYTLVLCPPESLSHRLSHAEPELPEYRIPVEVIWSLPEQGHTPDSTESPHPSPVRLGLQFLHFDDQSEIHVERLVAGLLKSPLRLADSGEKPNLVSSLMECRNQKGHHIALYYDRPQKPLRPGSPLVIIAPGFGETKADYIPLAYGLACNGFHVLRYDHTDHVGESQGEMSQTTLSAMKQDLVTILQFAEHTWPASSIVLIAAGLAGRVALKSVSQKIRLHLLILLNSILDLKATLDAVHQEDVIQTFLTREPFQMGTVLGWNVDTRPWLTDALQGGFVGLDSTVRDAEKIQIPTVMYAAEADPSAPYTAVNDLQAALGSYARHTYVLPGACHHLLEDAGKDRAIYRQVVSDCLEHCFPLTPKKGVRIPSLREIKRQQRLEEERVRSRHERATPRSLELMDDDLEPSQLQAGGSEYWNFLNDLYRTIGPLHGGERVLDAGCGRGHFGMALIVNQAYRQTHRLAHEPLALSYVGLDGEVESLGRTRQNLHNTATELQARLLSTGTLQPVVNLSFTVANLNRPLPYSANHFDRIVCNLAIDALLDPVFTLRELIRVLAPHGKLVLTTLKPCGDMTTLYRTYLKRAKEPPEHVHAQKLLARLGSILQGKRDRVYRSFDQRDLTQLIMSSGAQNPRIYSTLGNLVYVAVAHKPA